MTFLSPRRGLGYFSARGFSHRAIAGHLHLTAKHDYPLEPPRTMLAKQGCPGILVSKL